MNSWSHDCKIQVKLATDQKILVLRQLKVSFKVAVNTPGVDLTEKILPLTPKSKIKLISTSLSQRPPPHQPLQYQSCIYTRQTERSREYFMTDLFEILNDLKLVHDFINGA